jgi:hypothetical protein
MAETLLSASVMSIGTSLLIWLTLAQQPLSYLSEFLQVTRTQLALQLDEEDLMQGYTWRRRTIRGTGMKEHDVFQFDSGLYTKLVSENGVSIPRQDLEKQDSGALFVPKSDSDRVAVIEDMFRVWNFEMVGRESLYGRPTIVIAFEPHRNAKPETRAGKWLFRNSRGVAWIDEEDHRIARMHTIVTNDISLVWGLFAKVHKGTEIIREWRKVNDEVWLPSMSLKRLHARAFLVGVNFQEIEQYYDYRKFGVETNLLFDSPR